MIELEPDELVLVKCQALAIPRTTSREVARAICG